MTWYEGRLSEALDPAHAVELIEQGRRAMEGQDATTAKNVVRQLSALFPGDVGGTGGSVSIRGCTSGTIRAINSVRQSVPGAFQEPIFGPWDLSRSLSG